MAVSMRLIDFDTVLGSLFSSSFAMKDRVSYEDIIEYCGMLDDILNGYTLFKVDTQRLGLYLEQYGQWYEMDRNSKEIVCKKVRTQFRQFYEVEEVKKINAVASLFWLRRK